MSLDDFGDFDLNGERFRMIWLIIIFVNDCLHVICDAFRMTCGIHIVSVIAFWMVCRLSALSMSVSNDLVVSLAVSDRPRMALSLHHCE